MRKDTVKLPSGKVLDDYFVWESPDIAVVAPFTADGKFVLCQQYRHAINKILYQLPAGAVDKNETPAQAAARELEEETGYVSHDITFLKTVSVYCTKITGLSHLFLAKNAVPEGVKHEDEMEPTRVVVKTPEEVWELITNESVQVADSLIAAFLALIKVGKININL